MLQSQMFGLVAQTTSHDGYGVVATLIPKSTKKYRSNGMKILTNSILVAAAALSVTLAGCMGTKNMAAEPEPAPVASTAPAPEPEPVMNEEPALKPKPDRN